MTTYNFFNVNSLQFKLEMLKNVGIGGLAPAKPQTKVKLKEGFHSPSNRKEEDNLSPMRKGEMKNPHKPQVDRGDVHIEKHKFEKKVRWYHASPYKIKPGTVLKPNLMGKNFPSFSGERVYVTSSPHLHWTLVSNEKFKKAFIYEVKPSSPPQPGDYYDHHCKEAVVIRCVGRATNKCTGSDTRINSPRKWVEKHEVPNHLWEHPKRISEGFSEVSHLSSSAEMLKTWEWIDILYEKD